MSVLHFWGHFLLSASLRQQRMLMYISLFTVTVYVNYTNDFQGLLKSLHTVFLVSKYCIFKCYHKLCPRRSYVETVLGRESAELAIIHEVSMVPEKL